MPTDPERAASGMLDGSVRVTPEAADAARDYVACHAVLELGWTPEQTRDALEMLGLAEPRTAAPRWTRTGAARHRE